MKKCAQEYLARVKQEEQRYQTLKLHAEEKLDKYDHASKHTTHTHTVVCDYVPTNETSTLFLTSGLIRT